MTQVSSLSKTTQRNWGINLLLFVSALIASITGIYFLFLPAGGYRGGRNPFYGVTVLFERQTWDLLHTWGGIAMIAVAVVHFAIHWKWLVNTARRLLKGLTDPCCTPLNPRARFNITINAVVIVSFLLTAISGVYFLFFPSGRYGVPDPGVLFSRTTWDVLHTWSGIILISAAIIHFVIHWQWVVKVAKRLFNSAPVNDSPVMEVS